MIEEKQPDHLLDPSTYKFTVFQKLGEIHVRSKAESIDMQTTALNSPFLMNYVCGLAEKHLNLLRAHVLRHQLVCCLVGENKVVYDFYNETRPVEPVLIVVVQDRP